jgi:hypothetical protein
MKPRLTAALLAWACASPLFAQAPLPFPGAAAPPAEAPRQSRPAPAPPQVTPLPVAQPQGTATTSPDSNGPAASTVVFPIFPGSKFLGSYDAGKGQRYYLYGTTILYEDVVAFYRAELKDRGDEVFTEPPTHMFAQKFREDTMAFPPGVTVKDWTYQSKGYPNPRIGAQPERFPTVFMIVPPPPAAAPAAR